MAVVQNIAIFFNSSFLYLISRYRDVLLFDGVIRRSPVVQNSQKRKSYKQTEKMLYNFLNLIDKYKITVN